MKKTSLLEANNNVGSENNPFYSRKLTRPNQGTEDQWTASS